MAMTPNQPPAPMPLPAVPSLQEPFFRPPPDHVPFNPMGQLNFLYQFGLPGQIINSLIWWMFPSTGYTSFFGEPNLLSALERQSFDWAHLSYLQMMQQYDLARAEDTLRGIAALSGQRYEAIQPNIQVALNFLRGLPLPQQIAAYRLLTAGRSELALAARLHHLGRFFRDPVTGLQGLSAQSSMGIARQWGEYFFEGTPYRTRSFGFESQDLADIYFELARRGMGVRFRPLQESVIAAFNRLGQAPGGGELQRMVVEQTLDRFRREMIETNLRAGMSQQAAHDLTAQQREMLGRLREQLTGREVRIDLPVAQRMAENPHIQAAMRGDMAERARLSVARYAELLSVVRQMFDDMGKPNAPISELMEHLEFLAGGNLAGADPTRLRLMLTRLRQVIKDAGVGLEAVAAVHQETAKLVAQLELPREVAPGITTGTMQFISAAGQMGMPAGEVLGAYSLNEQAALFTRRQAGAARSAMANRLGVILRVAETLGGMAPQPLQQLLQQVESGYLAEETQRALTGSEAGFVRFLARASGQSEARIHSLIVQRQTNMLSATRLTSMPVLSAQLQRAEMRETYFRSWIQNALANRVPANRLNEAVNAVLAAVDRAGELSDEELRQEIARALGSFVGREGERQLIAETIRGHVLDQLRLKGLAPTIQQATVSPAIRSLMALQMEEANIWHGIEAVLPENLRLNFGGALERIAQQLIAAGDNPQQPDQLKRMALAALNLVNIDEAKNIVSSTMGRLIEDQRRLQENLQRLPADGWQAQQLRTRLLATGRAIIRLKALSQVLAGQPVQGELMQELRSTVHVETPPEFRRLQSTFTNQLNMALSPGIVQRGGAAADVHAVVGRLASQLHTLDISKATDEQVAEKIIAKAQEIINDMQQEKAISARTAAELRTAIRTPEFAKLIGSMSPEIKRILTEHAPRVIVGEYQRLQPVGDQMVPVGPPMTPEQMAPLLEKPATGSVTPSVPTASLFDPEKLVGSIAAAVQQAAPPRSIEMTQVTINIEGTEFAKGLRGHIISGTSRYRAPVGAA